VKYLYACSILRKGEGDLGGIDLRRGDSDEKEWAAKLHLLFSQGYETLRVSQGSALQKIHMHYEECTFYVVKSQRDFTLQLAAG
jgi:hypothetical protein